MKINQGGDSKTRNGRFYEKRIAVLIIMVFYIVVLISLSLFYNFLSDDAFILFRYANNLSAGKGLVFNPGERVEGYTSFIVVIILAALHKLGLDLVLAGRFLSLLGGIAATIAVYFLVRLLLPERPNISLVAPLLVCVNPYFAVWSGAGLETTLFTALILVSIVFLLHGDITRTRFLVSSISCLVLALTRPEGLVVWLVLMLWSMRKVPGRLYEMVRFLGAGIVFFTFFGSIYFLFRYSYFGDLLPNTFYAKSGFSLHHVGRGLMYVGAFLKNPFIYCLSPLLLMGFLHSFRRKINLPLVLLLIIVIIVIMEGGDGLPMYRFIVPAVPLMAAIIILGSDEMVRRLGCRVGLAASAILILASVILSFFPNHDTQYKMFINQRDHEIPRWSNAGLALGKLLPDDMVIAAVPIGAVAYYSGLRTIDMVGLTDRTVAHTPIPRMGSGRAGHEKYNSLYILSRQPDILLLGNIFVSDSPSFPWDLPLYSPIPAEKDLFHRPEFKNNYRRAALEIGNGKYLHFYILKKHI